jgi:hypothetical protein
MEFKIGNWKELETLPKRIEFNYEELKQELETKLSEYANKSSTNATNYRERKADRARLNELARSLDQERKNVKKTLLAPMENGTEDNPSFVKKVESIVGIIKMAVGEIDNGIKAYEESVKEDKRVVINGFLKSQVEDAFENLDKEMIHSEHFSRWAEEQMNRKQNAWLNATCDMDFIEGEITKEVQRCVVSYMALRKYMESSDELTKIKGFNELRKSFDITAAMRVVEEHIKELKEAQKAKVKKEEQQNQMLSEGISTKEGEPEEPIYSVTLKFVGKASALRNLKDYLKMNESDIKYQIVVNQAEVKSATV